MTVDSTSTTAVKWEDVAGLELAKSRLRDAVLPWMESHHASRTQLWKGILLFGSPGTGKSLLAKALASEVDRDSFISARFTELITKSPEEPEQRLKAVFASARDKKPSVLFVDDLECFCPSDNGSEWARRIKTEFLNQFQKSNMEGVLVLGATNVPWLLDQEILHQFQEKIYLPLPEESARKAIFRTETARTKCELTESDYRHLGAMTDSYSGADIFVVCREAFMQPVREIQTATHFKKVTVLSPTAPDKAVELYTPSSPDQEGAIEMTFWDIPGEALFERPITMSDLTAAISSVKPSITSQDLASMEEFIRRHEATASRRDRTTGGPKTLSR